MSFKKIAKELGLEIITEPVGKKRHPGKVLYNTKGKKLEYNYYYNIKGTYGIIFEDAMDPKPNLNEIIYVGSSDNIGERINNHFKPSQFILKKLLETKFGKRQGVQKLQNSLRFILLSNDPDNENKMINKHKPLLNKNVGRGWWRK